MIKGKNLVCPHKQDIETKTILGLVIYFHANDLDSNGEKKPCMLLNRLDVKQDTLSETQYSKIQEINTSKEVTALYASSKAVRYNVYKLLSQQEPKELVETLQSISYMLSEIAYEQDDFYLEMIQFFGQVGLLNVKIALGLDYTQKADLSRAPILPMKKITLEHIKNKLMNNQPSSLKRLEDIVDLSSRNR